MAPSATFSLASNLLKVSSLIVLKKTKYFIWILKIFYPCKGGQNLHKEVQDPKGVDQVSKVVDQASKVVSQDFRVEINSEVNLKEEDSEVETQIEENPLQSLFKKDDDNPIFYKRFILNFVFNEWSFFLCIFCFLFLFFFKLVFLKYFPEPTILRFMIITAMRYFVQVISTNHSSLMMLS